MLVRADLERNIRNATFRSMAKRIILASASPRRKQLMKKLDFPFEVVESNFEEVMDPSLDPHTLAMKLSLGKAQAVAKDYKNSIIIGADTFVICQGEILGKAHTKEVARKMLRKLSGKPHSVITGFTVIDTNSNRVQSNFEQSTVYIKKLTKKDIDEYIKTGEPLEKAGAYAIQELGAKIVERYEGDYDNIVGLPLNSLSKTLEKFGIQINKYARI